MKILIDIRLLGRGGLSGIEEYTRQITSRLISGDNHNQYELFYSGFRKSPLPDFGTGNKNFSVINWPVPNRFLDTAARLNLGPKIDSLLKADLIFSPHFNILNVSEKTPRVITFHDLSFIHHPDFFSLNQRAWHWLQNYKQQAEKAAKVIAVSEFTKNDLINTLKISAEKIRVVYPGVNPEFKKLASDDPKIQEFKKTYGLSYPFIFFLGTLEPRKNITAIIKAFNLIKTKKEYKDLKLIIAGKPGWLYKNILKSAEESAYRDEIIFWGPVQNKDRIFLYNLAEVFAYPSFFEGFGFPVLEAQACGTPVIISDRTSLPEILGNSGIAVDPWRTNDFAEKLENLLSDGKLKIKLINAGLKNSSKFSWDKTISSIKKIFNE